jgi:hypothetical protein
MRNATFSLLKGVGLDVGDDSLAGVAQSELRFGDGARYRIEIPSVEGPACLHAVLDAAQLWEVPVCRVSQGSGTYLLTDDEITEMVEVAGAAGVEVSLFARPCAGWDVSASSRSPSGAAFAAATWGVSQLTAAVEEIQRVAELGIRSVLIADLGLLSVFGRLRTSGALPTDMQAKISVMLGPSNPASAQALAALGADTINVAPDLSIAEIAALRRVVTVPLDVYIEAPDDLGGFVRYHELADLIATAAPVYVKVGLRNAAAVYPTGTHLDTSVRAFAVERVRRARMALDLLARSGLTERPSGVGAAGLAVPVRSNG